MTLLSAGAVVALVPGAVLPFRRNGHMDRLFWPLMAVAVAGPLAWAAAAFAHGWRTGLAPALWLTVLASLAVFAAVVATSRDGRRLAALLFPYLVVLGLVATLWEGRPERTMGIAAPAGWVWFHIGFSLATYAVLTLAAVAGMAAFLQEKALKAKRESALTRALPSLSLAEQLENRLFGLCAVMLVLGLLSGMAVQHFETGMLLTLNHKTAFSLAALGVVGTVLVARRVSGLRGRQAARLVLLAYLMLTLAYPGVKFVTDVLMT